jgi:hypothetical protein
MVDRTYWYQREFGEDYVPDAVILDALAAGRIEDHSYRHDTCPSFAVAGAFTDADTFDVRLWSHPANPLLREHYDSNEPCHRYAVCNMKGTECLLTDDPQVALDYLFTLTAQVQGR